MRPSPSLLNFASLTFRFLRVGEEIEQKVTHLGSGERSEKSVKFLLSAFLHHVAVPEPAFGWERTHLPLAEDRE